VRLLRRQWSDARSDFEAAVARGVEGDDRELLWQAYWGLGASLHRLGELDGAADALRKALQRIDAWRGSLATDEGKVTFIEGARDVVDELVDVELARAARGEPGAWEGVLAVVEDARARALRDLMARSRARRGERDPGAPPAATRCYGYGPGAPPSQGVELSPGVPSGRAHEAAPLPPYVQMAPGIPSSTSVDSPARPRAPPAGVAPPRLARLVFHVTPARSVVLAVARDGAVTGAELPLGEAELARRVELLLGALGLRGPSRGLVVAHAPEAGVASPPARAGAALAGLYLDLVAPVARALPPRDAPLVVEPDGVLWLVPFAALRSPRGELMIERWPLLYAPSAAVLDEIRAWPPQGGSPASWPALIVGNPLDAPISAREGGATFDFGVLPGAAKEASDVAALFAPPRPEVRTGRGAPLDDVVEHIHEYRVIHLATHGIALASDPLSSFLVLGDSRCGRFLTARDVTGLSLDADLVVLSACQTGLGQVSGDGVIGLARSFLVAGARSVVVSLWNVDDARTAELMVAFHREYLTRGADKASALRRAMLAMRRKGHTDPRLWASFLLVGAER
jgi:hypothetical protein